MSSQKRGFFEHDCPGCKYLGSYTYDAPMAPGHAPRRTDVDLYVCMPGLDILSRYDNDDGAYASIKIEMLRILATGMHGGTYTPALIEALRRFDASK